MYHIYIYIYTHVHHIFGTRFRRLIVQVLESNCMAAVIYFWAPFGKQDISSHMFICLYIYIYRYTYQELSTILGSPYYPSSLWFKKHDVTAWWISEGFDQQNSISSCKKSSLEPAGMMFGKKDLPDITVRYDHGTLLKTYLWCLCLGGDPLFRWKNIQALSPWFHTRKSKTCRSLLLLVAWVIPNPICPSFESLSHPNSNHPSLSHPSLVI